MSDSVGPAAWDLEWEVHQDRADLYRADTLIATVESQSRVLLYLKMLLAHRRHR